MRLLTQLGQLAVAHLVQDLAGFLVAKVVMDSSLARSQRAGRRACQIRAIREHLVAG